MECFEILGLEPTQDKELIKQAYRRLLPNFHPEDDPIGFQRLRTAYDEAMKYEVKEEETDMSETGVWVRKAYEVYGNFEKRLDISCWEELLDDEVSFSLDTAAEANFKLLSFLMNNFYIPHEVWSVLEKHFNWEENKKELCDDFPSDFVDYICANAKYEDSFRYYLFENLPGNQDKDYDRFINNYFYLIRNIYNENAPEKEQRLEESVSSGIWHPDFTILRIRYALQDDHLDLARELSDGLLAVRQDVPSWYSAARLELALKNTEKAREYSERVLAEMPEHVGAQITVADSWFREGNFEEALECYKKASETLPYDSYVNNAIFNTYHELAEQYKDKLQNNPTEQEKFKYFEYCVKSRNFDDALSASDGLCVPEDECSKYHMLLGQIYSEKSEYEKAIVEYEKALGCENIHWKEGLYADLGLQYLNLGRYEEAAEKYEEGLSEYEDSTILTYRKAAAKIKLGKYEEAVALCDKILSKRAIPNAYHFKAEALYFLEEYGEALKNCDLAMQIEKYYLTYLLKLNIYSTIRQYDNLVELANYLQSVELGTNEVLILKVKALIELKKLEAAKNDIDIILGRDPDNSEALYQYAKVLYFEENYKESLEYLQKSESGISDKKSYTFFLANLYVNLKMDDEAVQVYHEMLKEDQTSDYIYYRLGYIYERSKKYGDALTHYEKALELNPGHYHANGDIADIYQTLGENYKALSYNKKQLEINPIDYYFVQRGNLYGRLNDTDNQLESYQKALELNPNNSFAHNNSGNVYMKLGKYEQAVECFYKSIGSNHPYREPYLNLDLSLSKLKRYDEAFECLNKGAEKFPENEIFDLRRGNLKYHIENYAEAQKFFITYFEKTKDIDYCIKIGRCHKKLGYYQKALEFYNKAHYIDKKSGDPFEEIGDLHFYEHKDYKNAMYYYKKALKQNEKSGYLPLYLGKCCMKIGKKSAAADYFKKALENYLAELKTDDVEACDYKHVASVYVELGEYEKAIEYFNIAIEKAPLYKYCRSIGCYDAYSDLGDMYEAKGDYENALKNFELAFEVNERTEYKEALDRLRNKT